MNRNIYELRRYGFIIFIVVSAAVVAGFLYYSNLLVKDLSEQERARMQIWADATKEIINITSVDAPDDTPTGNIDFLLNIIEENRSIPVLLTDDEGNILNHRNFDLPEPIDSTMPCSYLSDINYAFLMGKLERLRHTSNVINIIITPTNCQHLYYEDSKLLKSLSLYPYVQVIVLLAFVLIVYYAVSSTKRAEQNKVWVGLSKETAHQLGTPISSLMAWMELLEGMGVEKDVVKEMDKDVKRLSTIASRFSKIGSRPQMELENLNEVVEASASYMKTRISSRIRLTTDLYQGTIDVSLSRPLMEWVLENLIKNAVDAMEGSGAIHIITGIDKSRAFVEVSDTGKGIQSRNFDTVFNPGYTTKKRGWGLGLALARRIVAEYHGGRIFVKSSVPGQGTTFRIELPLAK
ncbi:MAG: HAMP domain-containing histidine kinase [Duncaniella sp.]|nr:HAMP domain-containing histidine kinase [Duncaniella sp.]